MRIQARRYLRAYSLIAAIAWALLVADFVRADDDRPVILFIGTSLTAGYGLPSSEAFPALIQRRVDPDDFGVEMIDTPFSAPRRLRFDLGGKLWIPGFSSGLVSRFDPETREFDSWMLPIEPLGSETPYALNVSPRTGSVWICGTNSDSLIRFDPSTEKFTVFPLPTRVTYTREIDFDSEGRVWSSNSNLPAWQIEGGQPRVLRLDPEALESNLQGILDRTRADHPKSRFVIAGMRAAPNLGERYRDQFDSVFPAIAAANDAVLIPFLLEGVAGDPALNQVDRIHPTAEGQRIIAARVWKSLQGLLSAASASDPES
jgi:lysophospholipase L1-like esterase